MLIKRSDFSDARKLETIPGGLEAELFSTLAKEARLIGEFTFEIVKHAWLNHLFRIVPILLRKGMLNQRLPLFLDMGPACLTKGWRGHVRGLSSMVILLPKWSRLFYSSGWILYR